MRRMDHISLIKPYPRKFDFSKAVFYGIIIWKGAGNEKEIMKKKDDKYRRPVYSKFAEDELWLIKETDWDKDIQHIREAQFALGNGYIGSRSVLEEFPYNSKPGTYIAGIYDKLTAQVSELVNFPDPVNFKFSVGGEKIGMGAMDVLNHRRVLNMKKGVLLRDTLYQNSKGHRFAYESLRFISMQKKNIGAMQIVLTPLDRDYVVDVQTGIDTSVYNSGTVTEGRKKHFRIKELGQHRNAGYLVVETFEKRHALVYWSGFHYEQEGKKTYARDNIFNIKVKKGKPITFTKIFYIEDFPGDKKGAKHKEETFSRFYRAFHSKFTGLLNEHIREWERLWAISDVIIKGTANLQVNMRFNIYHMLICGHFDDGFSSIGARTLSGEGYRGHIFWDTEIFLMPFYLLTNPDVARNMLLYRYKRLDEARKCAQEAGYKGAMFPWESAESGAEETPTWAKDINGEIVKIYTGSMEHHITPDIAYTVKQYH
ncbi:MAG: glycoside hydrolase family 65 protein, partial [Candidatus Omnitrophica bacterium]|nr:glycoside hydrolase family 65 protein [Candidatus Omnitrophota bacterium]